MTKMVITFLMETFIAFDDEDGYNAYLGNIHCLFMNAFPMVSLARTPGDQIESSHPVPTSEKIITSTTCTVVFISTQFSCKAEFCVGKCCGDFFTHARHL